MILDDGRYEVRLAETEADLRAAGRLRYTVFVEEMGGDGPLVDHEARIERDRFDPHCDHLLLVDREADGDGIVGVYRLMPHARREAAGAFYSEEEFDLSVLFESGRSLLEVGRSCLDPAHRGGLALHRLWSGLADYVAQSGADVLFGVASFHGTDVDSIAEPLSLLHARFLAPDDLRVVARGEAARRMDRVPVDSIDRARGMAQVPALIKSYLRLGGFVGEGAWIDEPFNTTDICLVMDTERMTEAAQRRYSRERAA